MSEDPILSRVGSAFPERLCKEEKEGAQSLLDHIEYFNCTSPRNLLLNNIIYREPESPYKPVFIWSCQDVSDVFKNGFQAEIQDKLTPTGLYYSIEAHILSEDPRKQLFPFPQAYLRATSKRSWFPRVEKPFYCYEIYAPGGIDIKSTIDEYDNEDNNNFSTSTSKILHGFKKRKNQCEVAYARAIRPEYIRSARKFRLERDSRGRICRKQLDDVLFINNEFRPPGELRNPITYYYKKSKKGEVRKQHGYEIKRI